VTGDRPPVPQAKASDVARLLVDLVPLVDPVTMPEAAELIADHHAVVGLARAGAGG
jgi:hypothetical protein